MPKTLSPGTFRAIPRTLGRACRVAPWAQRLPPRRGSAVATARQTSRRVRVRTRMALAIIGLLVVVVVVAAILTTFVIAGIQLSLTAPTPDITSALVATVGQF